jgi:hypothetical protein
MTGSNKPMQTCRLGSRRARTLPALILALATWLPLAALLLAVGLTLHSREASASMLFQTEPASPTPGAITDTVGITDSLVVPPLISVTATTPTETPTATPTQSPPTPEPTASWTPTPSPTVSPEPISTAQTGTSSKTRQHYVRGDSNITFQWGMLVDSLALGISYAWLFAGILVGVGLPILFVVLWVKTKRRRSAQE